MDINELKRFFCKAQKNGYPNEKVEVANEKNGSYTITYKEGPWFFHDNFFGGEPFAGKDVIFYNDKAVWIMLYYGWVHDTQMTPDEVYRFLRKALAQFPKDYPYRGPNMFEADGLVYKNKHDGEMDNFFGEETIWQENEEIYMTRYFGGWIDRREGY